MSNPAGTKLPVIMCSLAGCPYRKHSSTILDMPLCQQHQYRYIRYGDFNRPLSLKAVEPKYTRGGYPLLQGSVRR